MAIARGIGWRHRLPLAFLGGGLVLIVTAAALSVHRISEQGAEDSWVAHTHEVLQSVATLRESLAGVEADRRAFFITGDASFQRACLSLADRVPSQVDALRRLTADNPKQQAELRELDPLVSERIETLKRHSARGVIPAEEQLLNLREAAALGARIDDVLVRMRSEEEALLEVRRSAAQQAVRRTQLATLFGGVAGAATVLAGGWMFVHENRCRRLVESDLLGANRRLADALRDVEAAARTVQTFFESSLDFTAIAELDGYFKKVNPTFEKVLGWKPEEILARPWLEFVHPDDHAATVGAASQLASGAPVIRFENRYRCKDGSFRWISWSTPAPAPGSSQLYCTGRDVTDLREAQQRVSALNARLEERHRSLTETNKELEAFSYSVSHDLRAPLRHVNGFSDLLLKHAGAALDDQGRHYLKTIADAATKMGRLIDDLLSFSRTGRAELRRIVVSMSRLVGEAREVVLPEIAGREISWAVQPLPDACGDPALLRQVWANLLSNAVKFTRMRPDSRIEIGVVPREDGVPAYFVRDNGAGFDMKYANKLFGVFQRLHSAQEFEGTGIGLANAKRIVSRHGGTIWADGTVGAGATFFFTIPPSGEKEP